MLKILKTKVFNTQFQHLRWQLLGSYLIITSAILIVSDVMIYQFFARNLYQQLDQRLLHLAQAATHSLTILKKDSQTITKTNYKFDKDGDLDIPWQNLRQPSQSVEWFNYDKKLLNQAGILTHNLPIEEGFKTVVEPQKLRIVTIAVYQNEEDQEEKIIEGFVRVSESSKEIESILGQLRREFFFGGLMALGFLGMGGMWLTYLALKPVEQSFQQLKQFTADASHELRSPLTVIKTSIEVIQTHPERIHPLDQDKFKGIVSAINQINRLIEDLLWLARNDATFKMSLKDWQVIPLQDLLEDAIEFVDFKAEAKNITLNFELNCPVLVTGNPSQLLRLFSNFLDNAIKYTPPNGIVTLTLKKVDKFALINIEDTGMGISDNHLSLIFNRFWREDSARCHEEGTGLGLAIAKEIIINHHGKISVSSELNKGSCFNIYLPLNLS